MSLIPPLTQLERLADSIPSSGRLLLPARALAFWLAVALPLVYLPLLASGAERLHAETFLVLLVANILALVVGHNYRR